MGNVFIASPSRHLGGGRMKRCWTVLIPGKPIFTMILMEDDADALQVVRSIWPEATVQ